MVGPASASVIVLVAVGECTCARLAEAGGQAFQAFEQLKLTAALTSLTSIARMLTAAAMLLVLRHATVRQWVIASLCVSCLSATVALVLVTTRLGWPKVDLRLLRQRALEGIGFSFAASTTSVYNDIDKVMLSRYGMLAADGIYSMAYRVIDMSCTPIRALQSAAFPRFCQIGPEWRTGLHRVHPQIAEQDFALRSAGCRSHVSRRARSFLTSWAELRQQRLRAADGCACCRYFAASTWAPATHLPAPATSVTAPPRSSAPPR